MGKSGEGMDRNNSFGPYTWKLGQPYLNDRRIHIIFKPGQYWQRHVSGVYKITFGGKFYIGRTKLMINRWVSHHRNINAAIAQYPLIDEPNKGYYGPLIQYLHENPKINVGYIEVLHQCENEYELWYMENKYLQDNKTNPDCVNLSHYGLKPNKELLPLVQQRVYLHFRWFYNPSLEQEAIELDEITTSGKIRKQEKIKHRSAEMLYLLQQICDKYGFLQ